jgi:hypothetical protein
MINKILLFLGFVSTIFGLGWVNAKRSEKNKANKKAIKLVKNVKKRDRKRSSDDITAVRERLLKNARDR